MTRCRRDRGAVLPLFAMLLPVLILMTAFAVDLGRQRASRREMQARADIIALDMVRLADGRTEAQILSDPDYVPYLRGSAQRNHALERYEDGDLIVEYGTWSKASGFIPTEDAGVPDAVRVTAEDEIDYFFQPGTGNTSRSAVAAFGEPEAGFSIGSFGAAVSPTNSGVLNDLLTPLLGHPVGLNALSYQGLTTADVRLGDLATELGLLTPDAALNSDVAVADAFLAAADLLERDGDVVNANLLRGLITPQVQELPPISLGDIVSAHGGSETAALGSDVNVLDLITAAAFASQCTDPEDLGTCSALNIPQLSTSLPLLDIEGGVRIIQGKVSHFGPVGTGTSTNQTQVDLGVDLGAQAVGTCKPTLANLLCILNGLLVGAVDASVTLDTTVKLADASGTIANIGCGGPRTLDIDTRNGLYQVDVTVTVAFGRRGALGGLLGPLLGSLTFTGTTNQLNTFDTVQFEVPPDVLGETTVATGNGDGGLSTIALTPQGGTGVLNVLNNLGIGMTVGQVLSVLVNPLLTLLDNQLLGPLSNLLGVNVSGSDVTPLDIACDGEGARLVG